MTHEVEYVHGDVQTQNVERLWSILKRGVYGVFHHVGEGYLPQYLSEFEFRFNRRKVSDADASRRYEGPDSGAASLVRDSLAYSP